MSEGVKLVPKRKLIGPDGGDIDVTISHILDNQQNIVPQIQTSWTITGGSPSLYFIESDQTDPDGRWRLQGTAKGFVLQRQLTANWATSVNVLAFDPGNSRTDLSGPLASGLGGIFLTSGNSSTTGAELKLGTSATSGLAINTANASGVSTNRLSINTGVATATIDLIGTVAVTGSIAMSNSFRIKTGTTTNDLFYIGTPDTVFVTVTNAATDSCKLSNITMDGTWLASGTVTLPAITFNDKITSTVGAGSPILKATATSDTPTATWGAAAGNEVSTAPSGWLEIQDGSDNTRYVPFWA